MSSIVEMLTQQLGGSVMKQISGQLGADEKTTGSAVAAALPTLLGALARNATSKEGAESLAGALDKDHDGGLLDNLSSFLGNPQAGPGEGILRHALGGNRQRVESGISKSTGLDAGAVGKLLTMLAPIIMGSLGKAKRQGGMDAGALAGLLGREQDAMAKSAPQAMGLVGQLLDADGDGDVDAGDIAKQGIGLLGKLMGKK